MPLIISASIDYFDLSLQVSLSLIIPSFKSLVLAAEAWQQEVRAMMPAPTPTPVDSGAIVGSRAHSRAAAAAAASASISTDNKKLMPASLRRVEQLLHDGERLPFELKKVPKCCVYFDCFVIKSCDWLPFPYPIFCLSFNLIY